MFCFSMIEINHIYQKVKKQKSLNQQETSQNALPAHLKLFIWQEDIVLALSK